MTQLAEWIAEAAVWCEFHRPTITLLTTLQAGLMAGTILSLRRLALQEERWAKHFGWGFVAFTILYALNTVDAYAVKYWGHALIPAGTVAFKWVMVGQSLLSAINTVLFLAAGRVLLGSRLPLTPVITRRVFIPIVIIIAAFAAGFMVVGQVCRWPCYGVFDGFLSAYCVFALGYGMRVCLRPTRSRRWLVEIPLLSGIVYALLLAAVSLVPFTPPGWWPGLAESLLAQLSHQEPNSHVHALEAAGMALAFVLKLGLFLGAFALMVTATAVPARASDTLKKLARERHDFLSTIFLEALAETVRADAVELCLLRARVAYGDGFTYWRWARDDLATEVQSEWVKTPAPSLALEIVSEGRERLHQKRVEQIAVDGSPVLSDNQFRFVSALGIPIRHSGAVVGGLVFWWTRPNAINATVRQRARGLAIWFASLFQTHRQVAALYESSKHLANLYGRPGTMPIETMVELIVVVAQRVLRPLASGVDFDFGFNEFRISWNERDRRPSKDRKECGASLEADVRDLADLVTLDSVAFTAVPLLVEFTKAPSGDLTASTMDSASAQTCELGQLGLAIQEEKDPSNRPTFAGNRQLRETVAAQIAGALQEYFRRRFDALLAECQAELLTAQQSGSMEGWFNAVSRCTTNAGFAWAVVTIEGHDEYRGPDEALRIVRAIRASPKRIIGAQAEIKQHELSEAGRQVRHVVEVVLPVGHHLWLGVPRPGFGREFDCQTPWRVFVERLAEVSGATIAHISTLSDLQRLQLKAARDQAFVAVAAIQASMAHRLHNLSQDVSTVCSALLAAHVDGRLTEPEVEGGRQPYRDMIRSMKESSETMHTLMGKSLDVMNLDLRRPCRMTEVVGKLSDLYGASLKGKYITLNCEVISESRIDLPFDVILLALSTLIDNAVDAKPTHGRIAIASRDVGAHVECLVSNDGSPIPEDMRSRLFDAGFTTKPAGLGWGLYLVRRALRENGGDITLEAGSGQWTTFLLRFPKPPSERGRNESEKSADCGRP